MAASSLPASRRAARALWPLAVVLALLPAVLLLGFDWSLSGRAELLAIGVLPIVLAVGFTGFAVGGSHGIAVTVGLAVLAAYWAWWFRWDSGFSSSPYLTARGFADAGSYLLTLLALLWPLALVATASVVAVTRRRGWPTWSALGLLTLSFVALATPAGAVWTTGCIYYSGPSPLRAGPIASEMKDLGVGIIVTRYSYLAECAGTDSEHREHWQPFWGDRDGLTSLTSRSS